MKDGICPKCGSDHVYSGAGIHNKEGPNQANTIPVGGQFAQPIALDNYVCIACGYTESYISDLRKLSQIAERWSRVHPEAEPQTADDEITDLPE